MQEQNILLTFTYLLQSSNAVTLPLELGIVHMLGHPKATRYGLHCHSIWAALPLKRLVPIRSRKVNNACKTFLTPLA